MLRVVYGAYPATESDGLAAVTVTLRRGRGLRRFVRPQVEVVLDGELVFEPYPADTPLPLLEWSVNYALASRLACYLLLHAGVVERDGRAIVLPAVPGSGKSTLTAALAAHGFRLLSDEFGVVRLSDVRLLALLRPVALKNASIDVIQSFAPDCVLGPRFPKTHKGTVAHLAPNTAAVDARHEPAAPGLVIFPRYDPSIEFELEAVPRARAFARLAVNSFNYEILGPDSFEALGALIQRSDCYALRYRDLSRAVDEIAALHRRH
jgi:HprK-related kinase A